VLIKVVFLINHPAVNMRHPNLLRHLLCLPFVFLSYQTVYGQTDKKHDIVLKTNGDELKGDIVAISDSTVTFTYAGEKLQYTLKKSEILKITFASGRVENYSKPAAPATAPAPAATMSAETVTSSPEERRNKVAILPFSFVKDGQNMPPETSEEIQNECYALLSKHSGVYAVVSPRATNVKLNKAGINKETVLNYTMAEICGILGVEYVVDGMITQNRTTQTTYGSSTYNDKSKDKDKSDKKSSGSSSTYSTSTQNYQTVMDMKIYNDKSEIIYNQNRKAFWNTEDAYKNTMEYLIKRCPLYTK